MIKKRINEKAPAAKKPAAKKAEAEVADNVSSGESGFTYHRTIRVQVGAHWVDDSIQVTAATIEEASERIEEASGLIAEKLQEFAEGWAPPATQAEAEEEEAVADAEEEEAEDSDAIGPEQVGAMSRPQLIELITENDLEIDPDDYEKNKKGLGELREAVIAAAFGDEDEDESEEAEEEEASEEEESEDGEDEDGITEEQINAMKRDELIELIDENKLGIKYKSIPKLAELRAAVIEKLSEEEEEEEAEEEEEEAEEEAEGYTRDELNKLPLADLKEIYKEWKMGKFPAGTPTAQKKVAISAILKKQEG